MLTRSLLFLYELKYTTSSDTQITEKHLAPPLSNPFFSLQIVFEIKMNSLNIALNDAGGGESVGLYSHTQSLSRNQIMHFWQFNF